MEADQEEDAQLPFTFLPFKLLHPNEHFCLSQVRAVMEAEQKKTSIKDPFMAELLKEAEPTGVVAGDRAKQTNPTPTDGKARNFVCRSLTSPIASPYH